MPVNVIFVDNPTTSSFVNTNSSLGKILTVDDVPTSADAGGVNVSSERIISYCSPSLNIRFT